MVWSYFTIYTLGNVHCYNTDSSQVVSSQFQIYSRFVRVDGKRNKCVCVCVVCVVLCVCVYDGFIRLELKACAPFSD